MNRVANGYTLVTIVERRYGSDVVSDWHSKSLGSKPGAAERAAREIMELVIRGEERNLELREHIVAAIIEKELGEK